MRHASWLSDDALRLLERRGIALVAADTAGRHPRSLVRTSRDLAYVRLHGARRLYEGHYTDDELADWAGHCAAWAADGARVFVYFDNDRDAAAVHDALRLDGARPGSGRERLFPASPAGGPDAPRAALPLRISETG